MTKTIKKFKGLISTKIKMMFLLEVHEVGVIEEGHTRGIGEVFKILVISYIWLWVLVMSLLFFKFECMFKNSLNL